MKRKVIKIANTTYVVSIPLKWIRANNIEKGHDVNLELLDGKILLDFKNDAKAMQVFETDVKSTLKVADRYVTSLYRKGADEITIRYSRPETLQSIQSCLGQQTIGLEIISQKKDFCVIKDLSGFEGHEFQNVLRRLWLLIKEMAHDSISFAQQKDKESLKNMFYRDRDINKFSNYCCRIMLNDKSISEYERIIFFHFIRDLEEIADSYKDFCLYFEQEMPKLSKEVVEIFLKANALFDRFYSLFYTFSDEELDRMLIDSVKLNDAIEKIFASSKNDAMSLHFLCSVIAGIRNLLSTVLDADIAKRTAKQ